MDSEVVATIGVWVGRSCLACFLVYAALLVSSVFKVSIGSIFTHWCVHSCNAETSAILGDLIMYLR